MSGDPGEYDFQLLGDNPLDLADKDQDTLDIGAFVRPLAERIKHSKDNSPFTVGVFAEWGQGKSSAMKLLEHQLKTGPGIHIVPVWFYPWKYHSREEVWRGLALSLVRSIQADDTVMAQLKRRKSALQILALKGLWRFLFTISGVLKEKWADELVEVIAKEPWSPDHLHQFEQTLSELFTHLEGRADKTLLVLFIDDLDRCLPEPATAVLEALKLVLNRKGLVTVLGLSERQVHEAVGAVYARAMRHEGVDAAWGRDYLRKIIQVPVYLPQLSQNAINRYVVDCLQRAGIHKALPLTDDWAPVLSRVCLGGNGETNLREVKRLLNRYIADWYRAKANEQWREATTMVSAGHTDPARLSLVLAADHLAPGFLEHCLSGGGETLIRYQEHFLAQDSDTASGPQVVLATNDKGEDRYAEHPGLATLFKDCLVAREDRASLVRAFKDWLDASPYLVFGQSDVQKPEVEKTSTAKAEKSPVEPPWPEPEPEPESEETTPEDDRTVVSPPGSGKKAVKAGAKQTTRKSTAGPRAKLLKEVQRAMSEGRAKEALEQLWSAFESDLRNREYQAAIELLDALSQAAILEGDTEVLRRPWPELKKRFDDMEGAEATVLRVRTETAKAELRRRLWELLQEPERLAGASLELFQALLHELKDPRKGVGMEWYDRDEPCVPAIDWVDIPAGAFIYQEDERIEMPAFRIARYPVTHAQFQCFVDDPEGYADERCWEGLERPEGGPKEAEWPLDNHPRENVSWYEAMAFCRWLSQRLGYEVRLPHEQEWERAARATDGREFPWGDGYQPGRANVDEQRNADGPYYLQRTSPVGLYEAGASAEGAMDLAGNVREWCQNNEEEPDATGADTSGEDRVIRGGSWVVGPGGARSTFRDWWQPYARDDNVGFRLLCSVPSR